MTVAGTGDSHSIGAGSPDGDAREARRGHGGPAEVGPSAGAPLKRLHPLTPLVRGAKVLGALTAIGAYRTYQTIQEVGVLGPLAGVALVGAVAVLVSWVGWRFTGYRVTRRELHIQAGIVARRHRTVPLERVQAIDVVRPVLARLLGLAELRLEVVGGNDTEATLAYLSTSEAASLRGQLLALTARADGDVATAATTSEPGVSSAAPGAVVASAPEAAEQPLFAVDRTQLIGSQLLTPYTFALPFLIAWPLISLATDGISVATIFGAASGVVGVAQVPVRRILREYGFAVAHTPQGLRIRSGLLETRTQTVPPGRVQAVRIYRPLLWRPLGWVRVEIDVAGYSPVHGQEARQTGALVPVADARTAAALIRQVLPDGAEDELAGTPLSPAPERARWLAPFQRRQLAAGTTGQLYVSRSGWLMPQESLVVHARMQSVRYTQGPVQRLLGLASVHADLAGGHGSATAEHQDATVALGLLSDLVARAAANRTRVTHTNRDSSRGYIRPDGTLGEPADC